MEYCEDLKAARPLTRLRDFAESEIAQDGLLFAGFLRCPVSLQFGRQLSLGCRTYCFLLGHHSGFDWKRRWFSSSKVRPPCFLSSRNLPFHRSAHGPFFLWRSSRFGWRTEDTAELFIQSFDSFFNRGSSFELVNCKVR